MNNGFRNGLVAVVVLLVPAGVVLADVDDKPVVGHFSFGASLPQGDVANAIDDGWALHGGATWFNSDRPLGWRLDVGVDWWDLSDELLEGIDTTPETPLTITPPDDGDARAWSGTVNALWKPSRGDGKVGFYLTGGAGVYYTQTNLSEVGYGTGYWCDWYWGICYPGIVEGEYILEDDSSWEWGANAGAAITFKLNSGAELYLEAIYHWVDTENSAEFVPIQLGFRW
jgi:hypothetical protein